MRNFTHILILPRKTRFTSFLRQREYTTMYYLLKRHEERTELENNLLLMLMAKLNNQES